jgi:CHAT domain-containing protein/tetratricopeptide (TPR) repeat protein
MFTRIPQRTHSSYPCLLLCLSLLLLLALSLPIGTLAAQNDKDTQAIEPGKPIVRELAGGRSHSYRIALISGQFLFVVVDQRGIDVVVTLFGPDDRKIVEVDSPNGMQGLESVLLVAEASGSYRLEVRSLEEDAAAGHYQVKIEELRTATEHDRSRIAAQRAYMAGEQLLGERSADSQRKAIEKFEQSRTLWSAANDPEAEILVLLRMAAIYGDDHAASERQKALEYLNRGLLSARAAKRSDLEGFILSLIGDLYKSLGKYQLAISYQVQALPLIHAANKPGVEATVLDSLGEISDDLGEKQRAIGYFEQALELSTAAQDDEMRRILLKEIASCYDDLGDKQIALNYLERALPLEIVGENRASKVTTLVSIANLHNDLGERQKALGFIERALAITRTLNGTSKSVAINAVASSYDIIGEKRRALELYQQALELAQKAQVLFLQGGPLNNIARIYEQLGDKQKALDYYQQSLTVWRTLGNTLSDSPVEMAVLASIAGIESERNELSKALAHLGEALEIAESVRVSIVNPDLRASYFASAQVYYHSYIDLLMGLHKQNPSAGYDGAALQASERARARSLLELLAEAHADIRQGVDPQLLERERSLQLLLNNKAELQKRQADGPFTLEQAASAAKEIEALLTEYQEVEAEIRQTSKHYADLTQPRPLDLKGIQAQLDADTLLLEYALGAERSYLWLVSPTEIKSFELPPSAEVETAALQFYDLLTTTSPIYMGSDQKQAVATSTTDAQHKEVVEPASRLSQMLLGPVASQIGEKRLLIVTNGKLQYLPFGALPDPASTKQNAGNAEPLIVRHEIVNLPSVSVLATLRRELAERKSAPQTLAILADPVFCQDDERVKRSFIQNKPGQQKNPSAEAGSLMEDVERAARDVGARRQGSCLIRLRGTRKEADGILALVPDGKAKQALDFAASRALVSGGDLSRYRYVHFATHALVDRIHPELSAIVLSLVDESGKPQDGFLRAHEIYNLNLPADLVVLSACQTGLGNDVKGEGLVGLTRGFMYAGSSRVVMSLWGVDDEATAKLMVSFYRGLLKEGKRPSEALRAAQIEMMKQERWQAPHYWAAFVMQGEWK